MENALRRPGRNDWIESLASYTRSVAGSNRGERQALLDDLTNVCLEVVPRAEPVGDDGRAFALWNIAQALIASHREANPPAATHATGVVVHVDFSQRRRCG